MHELLSHRDFVAILFVALGFVTGVVVWGSWLWSRHRRAELEAALKHDMLSRGMSADQIERVLRAPLSDSGAGTDQGSLPAAGAG